MLTRAAEGHAHVGWAAEWARPETSGWSTEACVPVGEAVFAASNGAMTPQYGMMHLMHFGARCEGDFVIFDANNPPVINDENAPSVFGADARGSEAAKGRKERRA